MFDPHSKYVPGATETSRGIKIRFTNSELAKQFPDQMLPYCHFGNDMNKRFNGTLFRFPFRNALTAAESEISKTQYAEGNGIDELFKTFKKTILKVLLFLRHVKRIEVYTEDAIDDSTPRLLYYADVAEQKAIPENPDGISSSISGFRNIASNAVFGGSTYEKSNNWNAIPSFINGSDSHPMSKVSDQLQLIKLLLPFDSMLSQQFSGFVVNINFRRKHFTVNFLVLQIISFHAQNISSPSILLTEGSWRKSCRRMMKL